jgi:hypothetical protein
MTTRTAFADRCDNGARKLIQKVNRAWVVKGSPFGYSGIGVREVLASVMRHFKFGTS